jgi:hypothetical protein
VSPAIEGNLHNSWRSGHERAHGQLELMHDHLGSAYSASPKSVH